MPSSPTSPAPTTRPWATRRCITARAAATSPWACRRATTSAAGPTIFIGFLIQLWSRPIPTDFNRIKIETSQKCSEALLNLSKSFVESEMLTQVSLPLEPQLLRGILLRGVGRKQQTGHVPLFLTQARVLACEKGLQLGTAMITCPVP